MTQFEQNRHPKKTNENKELSFWYQDKEMNVNTDLCAQIKKALKIFLSRMWIDVIVYSS